MSKNDQNDAKNRAKQQQATNTANQNAAGTQLNSILGTAEDTAGKVLPGVVSGYSDIASTGGYDPSILGTINSTYGDLATTGGVSDADATSLRNRASEAATSAYSTGSDAASRMRAATGGYGVSGTVESDLARKGSQAAAQATEDTNSSITGLRQQGKIAGAGGLQTSQQAQTGNKLQSLAGSTNIYGMNEQQITATVNAILRNYQQTGELNNQDLSILTNLANQPGVFDKIVGTIGTLGGAAAGVLHAVKPFGV